MQGSRLKNRIDAIIAHALVLLMALMVINVSWQVASRYIFQNPSSFTDELARYMLIWVGMLGAAYVAGKDEHLAIDVLMNKMGESGRKKSQDFDPFFGFDICFGSNGNRWDQFGLHHLHAGSDLSSLEDFLGLCLYDHPF